MVNGNKQGGSGEYYTPEYIFNSMGGGVSFDMDVAAPEDRKYCHVPAKQFITAGSLELEWNGFVWMNPPYLSETNKIVWLKKLYEHNTGIALMPDRTSASWWQMASQQADIFLFVKNKIKFILPDGSIAGQPATGSTLFGYGEEGIKRLKIAEENNLGYCYKKN